MGPVGAKARVVGALLRRRLGGHLHGDAGAGAHIAAAGAPTAQAWLGEEGVSRRREGAEVQIGAGGELHVEDRREQGLLKVGRRVVDAKAAVGPADRAAERVVLEEVGVKGLQAQVGHAHIGAFDHHPPADHPGAEQAAQGAPQAAGHRVGEGGGPFGLAAPAWLECGQVHGDRPGAGLGLTGGLAQGEVDLQRAAGVARVEGEDEGAAGVGGPAGEGALGPVPGDLRVQHLQGALGIVHGAADRVLVFAGADQAHLNAREGLVAAVAQQPVELQLQGERGAHV